MNQRSAVRTATLLIALLAVTGCKDEPAEPTASPSTAAPATLRTPVPTALPTQGLTVLASADGTGTRALPAVDASKGVQVLVSCQGSSIRVRLTGVSSGTHACGDGSPQAFITSPHAGRRALVVVVTGKPGTTWHVAVVRS